MRIISLLPSSTEIVCALGLESSLVGRSHECDYPDSVKRIPVCSRAKVRNRGSGEAIHRKIEELLAKALSIYHVDSGKLKSLAPDVILTQSQCEVCAVSESELEKALRQWTGKMPRVVSLSPQNLEGVWESIRQAAHALEVSRSGEGLILSLKKQILKIAAQTRPLAVRPTVACVEWIRPLMAAGNWMPELVELAGGRCLFGEAGKHSPWMVWKDLVRENPDRLLIMPCSFDRQRARKELKSLTRKKEWHSLKAVRENHVYVTDGNQYFNRPSPRLAESLEILAEILHPERFRFGHEGKGWEKYSE